MPGALLGDGQDGMRVNRGHRDTNHLEPHARKAFLQQHLEIAPRSVSRPRIAQGGGFPQHENPAGVGRLHCLHHHRRRAAREPGREKPQPKSVVLDQAVFGADADGFEETGRKTITRQSQAQFQAAKHQQQRNQAHEHAEEPLLPFGEGRGFASGQLWVAGGRAPAGRAVRM